MRVLTFTTLFPNEHFANLGVFVKERMARVAELCDVEVVAPLPYAPAILRRGRARRLALVPALEEIAGLPVHHPRFWSAPGPWPRLKPALIARGSWPLVEALHESRPFDLVDTHFAHPDGAAAAVVARRLGVPLVVSVRGSDIHRDLSNRRVRPLILRTLEQAEAVIAVALPLADTLYAAGVPSSKIHVIENGVDTAKFWCDRARARRELGLKDRDRMVLAIGCLRPVKAHDLLLEAVARLGGNVQLWIAGQGRLRGELEAHAARLGLADRVRFLGILPQEHLAHYYAACDVFAHPSHREGCPNVVLEALASGCSVAATRVGHVPYLIDNDVSGLVVPPNDVSALAKAIRRLLESPLNRAAVRKSVASRTWQDIAQRVLHVFERSTNTALSNASGRIPQCSGQS